MNVTLFGFPFSGTSTLFKTLLKQQGLDNLSNKRYPAEAGMISVPDERLDRLSKLFKPEKQVNASFMITRLPVVEVRDGKSPRLRPDLTPRLRASDALLFMVRDFGNDAFPHPLGSNNPRRDMEWLESEMMLSDLVVVESRIERLERSVLLTKKEEEKKELDILRRCKLALEQEQPLRELKFESQEEKILRGYQFLTAKPLLYVLNVDEHRIIDSLRLLEKYDANAGKGANIMTISAEIEKEISELPSGEQEDFLRETGIKEPALINLIRNMYGLMGLISFFTVGEDECRSWTIRKGTNARKAAGVIHSDMERGFIRANVVSCEELLRLGSLKRCKEKALLRVEGKEYMVKDGDVMEILFNV